MIRLLVHVEGHTEENFVNEILCQHLYRHDFSSVSARLLGSARQCSRRGGIRSWQSVRRDILKHLKKDSKCVATTMVDYYGMPQSGSKAWPGRNEADKHNYPSNVSVIEKAIFDDISDGMGSRFNLRRFIPLVMIHEFEALLFSDCEAFARGIERPKLSPNFHQIRSRFSSPERINDSREHSPSKRIDNLVENYDKPTDGMLSSHEVGLDAMRNHCPHFRTWLTNLEQLIESGQFR